MADYAIHDTTLTGISNVIRKKDGTSALIDPADYADRINLMGMLEEKTASGAIASFSDGADTVPLKALTFDIEPIQASGTPSPSNPLPISGHTSLTGVHCGKNLVDFASHAESTYSDLTITANSDGSISFSGTPTRTWAHLTTDFNVYIPVGTYTISRNASASYTLYIAVRYEDNTTENITMGNTASKTFTTTKRINRIRLDISALSTSTNYSETVSPMLEVGNQATTYAPYSAETKKWEFPNPNPNLFDRSGGTYVSGKWKSDGTIDTSEWGQRAYTIAVDEKTKYIAYGEGFCYFTYIVYFDSNNTFISYDTITASDYSFMFTTPANCAYVGLSFEVIFGTGENTVKEDFVIYGGELDALGGKVTNGWASVEMTNLTWQYDSTNTRFFTVSLTSVIKRGTSGWLTDLKCSCYKTESGTANDLSISEYASTGYVYIKDTNYTDATIFKNSLSGQYICYPLATPTEISVDSVNWQTKLGDNNFYSDAGDTEVTYRSSGTLSPVLPTLVTKSITENGTYNASSDNADGYSSVTVNVEGIPKLTVNDGALNISNGTISSSSTYCYTDPFDCPSGNITLDCGEATSSDYNVGIEFINADNSHANYWMCSSRYRQLDVSGSYSATKKARLAFKKANLSKVLLMDFGNGKIYSALAPSKMEQTQSRSMSVEPTVETEEPEENNEEEETR